MQKVNNLKTQNLFTKLKISCRSEPLFFQTKDQTFKIKLLQVPNQAHLFLQIDCLCPQFHT